MEHAEQQYEIPEIDFFLDTWKNIHRPLPTSLFHYTDGAGMHGIITSGKLWASHVYYLNDSQEFKFAVELISDIFHDEIDKTSGEIARLLRLLHGRIKPYFGLWESIGDPYAVSFCLHGNLLSQWRAYAANGTGFAIGFSPKAVMEKIKSHPNLAATSKMLKIIYEREGQRQLIQLGIKQLLTAFGNHSEEEVLNRAPQLFSEMALCFKHDAFSEEQEWRLVIIPRDTQRVEVRISGGRLLPYISFPIVDPDEPPPYESITHGPTTEVKNTQKAIKILLGAANPNYWSAITVSGSDAPLRCP